MRSVLRLMAYAARLLEHVVKMRGVVVAAEFACGFHESLRLSYIRARFLIGHF